MSLKKFLSNFNQSFHSAEAPDYGKIEEGEYVVMVKKFTPDESQSGNPMFVWELEIMEGKYKGRRIKKHSSYHTAGLMSQFKMDLLGAGMKLNRFDELADRSNEMFYKELVVHIKPQENSKYMYINVLREYEEKTKKEAPIHRSENDPFADDGKPIEVTDDNLPF